MLAKRDSVCADQDRLSALVHNKLDDLLESEPTQFVSAPIEVAKPVAIVLQKSKTLTEKHALLSRQYRLQQESMREHGDELLAEQSLLS